MRTPGHCSRLLLALLLAASTGWQQVLGQGQNGSAPQDPFATQPASTSGAGPAELPPEFAPATTSDHSTQFGLAAGLGAPAGEPRMRYQGVATTAYSPNPITPYGAVNLGCSLGFVSPTFQSAIVGISTDFFQEAFSCGRCITVQCDDQSCLNPGRKLPALVADVCGSCTRADLSISTPLFKNLTGRDPGSQPSIMVSWDVISCTPYTQGTIKMLLKPGGNAFYQAFGFSNFVIPITAVQLNGDRLKHGSDNFWQWNPGKPIDAKQPLEVALLGSNRQVLRAKVPSLRNADLGVQFNPAG